MSATTTWALWDEIDCGENAKPRAALWKGSNGRWAYSLHHATGDEVLHCDCGTEVEARQAAAEAVGKLMLEAALDQGHESE